MELPNKYDTYTWIIKVGESCEVFEQYICWKKLCCNFYTLYKDHILRDELWLIEKKLWKKLKM